MSRAELFSQMKIHYAKMSYAVSPCAFSQMKNLVSSHKILMCETIGGGLAYGYFHKAHSFTTPIIINIFHTPKDLG